MKRRYRNSLFIVLTLLVLGVLSGCTDNHDKSVKLTDGNSSVENTTDLEIQFPDREYTNKDATFLRTVIFPKLDESQIDDRYIERVDLYTVELNEQEDGTIKGEVKGLAYVGNTKYNVKIGIATSTVRSVSFTMVIR